MIQKQMWKDEIRILITDEEEVIVMKQKMTLL